MRRLISRALFAACLAGATFGCAGYEGAVKGMRDSLLSGDKLAALKNANKALDVDQPDEFPKKLAGDNALLVTERATIKQGLGQYKSSAADFSAADKGLELLDLKNDTMGNIGKFLFSDDTTVYKAPAYEKLLLNTLNLLNYLARGDLEGARVESRRLTVMQKYLADQKSEQAALLGLGSYLAGFAFEMSGKAEEALQFYDEALADSPADDHSLGEAVRQLARCSPFRTERLSRAIGDLAAEPCTGRAPGQGTLLVVASSGLAPRKVAERIPIGIAMTIVAGQAASGPGLSSSQQATANRLALKGLLTWINFPVMQRTNERYLGAQVRVDRQPTQTRLAVDVSERVIQAWNSIKGTLMVAAITRMITRLIAGEATEQVVKGGGGNGIVALLAGLAVQGTLTAADTPDTRSWTTLPSKVFLSRTDVPAGRHEVAITFEGPGGRAVFNQVVNVPSGGFVVLPVATMR